MDNNVKLIITTVTEETSGKCTRVILPRDLFIDIKNSAFFSLNRGNLLKEAKSAAERKEISEMKPAYVSNLIKDSTGKKWINHFKFDGIDLFAVSNKSAEGDNQMHFYIPTEQIKSVDVKPVEQTDLLTFAD